MDTIGEDNDQLGITNWVEYFQDRENCLGVL